MFIGRSSIAVRSIVLTCFLTLPACQANEPAAIREAVKKFELAVSRFDPAGYDDRQRELTQLVTLLESIDVSKCPMDFQSDYLNMLSDFRDIRDGERKGAGSGDALTRLGRSLSALNETCKKYGVEPPKLPSKPR